MHPPRPVAFSNLLMDDAAPGRHPLDVACRDSAVVAHAIAMFHGSRQNVRDCLDSAVGMPRKPSQIVRRDVVTKVVEKEKRVEFGRVAESESAAQMDARAFERRLGLDEPLDRSNGHFWSP